MKVVVTQSAERDLEEASDFYEELEPGAGAYFIEKMVEEIDHLADTGGIHRKVWGYHKVVAVRFPYLIFYLVRNDTVLVRAIVDGRRKPARNHDTVRQRKQQDDAS
jgi:plasmid stabilization system protein ParE